MSDNSNVNDDKMSSEELKELGNKAFGKKQFDEAIDYYTKAILSDGGKNHVYFSNRSASYGGKCLWDKAADDAKECIKLDPTFIKGFYRLAAAQIELKQYDNALVTVKQALQIDNNNAQLLKQQKTIKQLKRAFDYNEKSKNNNGAATAPQNNYSIRNLTQAHNLDSATAKELQDLQLQYHQTNREYNTVQANLVKIQREYKINEVTKEELEHKIPAASNCYQSVGKMFVKSSRNNVMESLNKAIDNEKKKEKDLTSKSEYLERRLKSQQQNISELLKTSKIAI